MTYPSSLADMPEIQYQWNNPAVHTAVFKPIMEQRIHLDHNKYEIVEEGDNIHIIMTPSAQSTANIPTRLIVSKQMVQCLKEVLETV